MNSAEIDARLQEYTAAEHRIGANLHELRDHTVYQLLGNGVLQGATAKALAAIRDADPSLWDLFSMLGSVLDRARQIRGSRSRVSGNELRELTKLLDGPSVLVRRSAIPLAERGLTSAETSEEWMTIAGLLERMRSLYEPLRDTIARADAALNGLLPRLSAADKTLVSLRNDARELMIDQRPLDRIAATIEQLRDVSLTDPLSIPANAKQTLDSALHDAAAAVAAQRASHDAIAHDLTEAADLIDRCRAMVEQAAADRAAAAHKVVLARKLPLPPNINAIDGPRGLAATLQPIPALKGPWQHTRRELDAWLHQARRLEAQLQRVAAQIREPLERRDELRGRLRAFRAKMSGTGRSEDPVLSELSDEAHNELFTAPTDLRRAERLLAEFSRRLTAEPGAQQ